MGADNAAVFVLWMGSVSQLMASVWRGLNPEDYSG
jgi:hypothetical protein